MVESISTFVLRLTPRIASNPVTMRCQHGFPQRVRLGPTVLLPDRRFVDNVVVIHVQVQLEHPQLDIDGVDHWNEPMVIAWGTSRPVLTQVGEHVDMLSNEIHNWFAKADMKVPLPLSVPLGRGRHRAPNLRKRG